MIQNAYFYSENWTTLLIYIYHDSNGKNFISVVLFLFCEYQIISTPCANSKTLILERSFLKFVQFHLLNYLLPLPGHKVGVGTMCLVDIMHLFITLWGDTVGNVSQTFIILMMPTLSEVYSDFGYITFFVTHEHVILPQCVIHNFRGNYLFYLFIYHWPRWQI